MAGREVTVAEATTAAGELVKHLQVSSRLLKTAYMSCYCIELHNYVCTNIAMGFCS